MQADKLHGVGARAICGRYAALSSKSRLRPFTAFLLVLARVAGAFSFVPIPGFSRRRALPALFWPGRLGDRPVAGLAANRHGPVGTREAGGLDARRARFRLLRIGVGVAFLNESFILASQIFGLQAGYGYASTIDPSTEADSSVLQIFTHLASGMLFFAFGMDREIIRIVAQSLESIPARHVPADARFGRAGC